MSEQDRVSDGSDEGFDREVIAASRDVPVIVDFHATWCEPCRQLAPPLESAVRHARGEVRLVKIDIDTNSAAADRLRVSTIPAVFAFRGGRPVAALAGVVPAHRIEAFVAEALGGEAPDLAGEAAQAMDRGEYDAAIRAYAMQLFSDPRDIVALGRLAGAYAAEGEQVKAEAVLAEGSRLAAGNPEAEKQLWDEAAASAAIAGVPLSKAALLK